MIVNFSREIDGRTKESAGAPDALATGGGATHSLLPDYTEDEDEDGNDMTEETQRRHLALGDNMEVEEQGALGGTPMNTEPLKEGQNLSPDASHDFEESVSEKARVYILKNRIKTRVEDSRFGNVNPPDGKNFAVAPPGPLFQICQICHLLFLNVIQKATTNWISPPSSSRSELRDFEAKG